jgi:hypothetical protein
MGHKIIHVICFCVNLRILGYGKVLFLHMLELELVNSLALIGRAGLEHATP